MKVHRLSASNMAKFEFLE